MLYGAGEYTRDCAPPTSRCKEGSSDNKHRVRQKCKRRAGKKRIESSAGYSIILDGSLSNPPLSRVIDSCNVPWPEGLRPQENEQVVNSISAVVGMWREI